MKFISFSDFSRFFGESGCLFKVNSTKLKLSDISTLLGDAIPHEFEKEFDLDEEKYTENHAYRYLNHWRGIHAYCYRAIDGTENPDAEKEWHLITQLAANQSKKWVGGLLDFLIREHEDGLKINLKNIHTILFFAENFSLTAKDLSVIDGENIVFNGTFKKEVKKLISELPDVEVKENVLGLGKLGLLSFSELRKKCSENPSFLNYLKEPNILTFLSLINPSLPLFIKNESKLPIHLRAFEKVCRTDDVQEVQLEDILKFIAYLNDSGLFDLAMNLMKKELLNFSILFKQLSLINNDGSAYMPPEKFNDWLNDWAAKYDNSDESLTHPIMPTEKSEEKSRVQSVVKYGFPLHFQKKAENAHWMKQQIESGKTSTVHLDLSVENIQLNDFLWEYLLTEYFPYLEKMSSFEHNTGESHLQSIDLRGQIISAKHLERLQVALASFPYLERVYISKDMFNRFDSSILYSLLSESTLNTADIYTYEHKLAKEHRLTMEDTNAALKACFFYNEKNELTFHFSYYKHFRGKQKKDDEMGYLGNLELLFLYLRGVVPEEITKLDFDGITLSEESFEALMKLLPTFPNLKMLAFNQSLSDSSKEQLKAVIPKCQSLEELYSFYKKDPQIEKFFYTLFFPLSNNEESKDDKEYNQWLRIFKLRKTSLELCGLLFEKPVFAQKMLAELNPDVMKTITHLQCDFSVLSDDDFKSFIKNLLENFVNLVSIDIAYCYNLAESETLKARQIILIDAISLLPKLREIKIYNDDAELLPLFYEKLYNLVEREDKKEKSGMDTNAVGLTIHIDELDEPEEDDEPLPDNPHRNALIDRKILKENLKAERPLMEESRKASHSDTSSEDNSENSALPSSASSQTILPLTAVFKKDKINLPEIPLSDAFLSTEDTKTLSTLSSDLNANGEPLYPWTTDEQFNQDSKIILNQLLSILGNQDEPSETRIDFYHRFGLLPALIEFIKEGFKNQTLTWERIAELDAIKTFENNNQCYYLPNAKVDVQKTCMESVPRQLPRLLAGFKRDKELSVAERAIYDLWDVNPAHNPTLQRNTNPQHGYVNNKHQKFLNNFFNQVLLPVAEQRIQLYDELCSLESKKIMTLDVKQQQQISEEMTLLEEKIDLLSGFLKEKSAELKPHELFVATCRIGGIGGNRTFFKACEENTPLPLPLFNKKSFLHTDKLLSDSTYRNEMKGIITVQDLQKNNAALKKDTTNVSRNYAKDLIRKILGAFVALVTFPISAPILYFSQNTYGTVFQTKTKSCLAQAQHNAQALAKQSKNTMQEIGLLRGQ